jgi:hypothetical protein
LAGVIKVDTILDVGIRPPVTDPRNASQALDGQHRESEFIWREIFVWFFSTEAVLEEGGRSRNGPYVTVPPAVLLVAMLSVVKATSLGYV